MPNRILEIQQSSTDSNSFSAYNVELDKGVCWYYCISQDEMCLLARDKLSPVELTEQSEGDFPSDLDCYDAIGNTFRTEDSGVDIVTLFEYFMEKDDEKYERWENDGGDEGLSEAAESEFGSFFILAYKLWENINYPYQYLLEGMVDSPNTTEEVCNRFVQEIPDVNDFDIDEWFSGRH